MVDFTLLSAFLFGLLGGLHCASMCGGIVTVLGARHRTHRVIPIQPLHEGAAGTVAVRDQFAPLAYNAGRITSYTVAGALAGAIGSTAWLAANVLPVQQLGFVLVNLLMIVLGLALALGRQRLAGLEPLGTALWRRLAPTAARLLRTPGTAGAYAAGLVWGWLPCGMVYGVLVGALVSGTAVSGALLMLAFGLGTLPNLLAMSFLAQRGAGWIERPLLRRIGGLLIVGFGVAGLARIDPLSHLHGFIDLCLSPWR